MRALLKHFTGEQLCENTIFRTSKILSIFGTARQQRNFLAKYVEGGLTQILFKVGAVLWIECRKRIFA